MSFFSFLETQAAAELQHRRDMDMAETKSAETVKSGAAEYIEGHLARVGELPPWVIPAAGAVVALLLVWKLAK